jgi:hypothetical protein
MCSAVGTAGVSIDGMSSSNVDGDGSEVHGDGGDGDGDRWRWLWGHFPIPVGCQNRDFYPPNFIDGGCGAAKLFWKFRPFF